MKRTISVVALTFAIAVGATVLAAPGQASIGECQSNRFCFWWDSNYSGEIWQTTDSSRSSANVGSKWNDRASSWYNNTAIPYCIYWHSGYGGASAKIDPKVTVWNYSGAWNDQMTSFKPASKSTSTTVPGRSNYFCP